MEDASIQRGAHAIAPTPGPSLILPGQASLTHLGVAVRLEKSVSWWVVGRAAGMISGVPASQPASCQDLAAVVGALEVQVRALGEDNERLQAENTELRQRLGMNSTNSSHPPSSDSPYARPSALPDRPGGKPGKQRVEPGIIRRR